MATIASPCFALKIDVDTERGTRIGVPNLLRLFDELHISATFLFSLGPDNTGRALKRIFRPGFLRKVTRTNVVAVYGWRTLLNGVLWPGPHIARRHAQLLRQVQAQGHEVGIHAYDHTRWQDNVQHFTAEQVMAEFAKARQAFSDVFHQPAQTAGAAGWQANAGSLAAYDAAQLRYASDCRGTHAFYPRVKDTVFRTLQLPTTLPTLDELLGRPEFPENRLTEYYLSLLHPTQPNIFTLHAEIEGMAKLNWFRGFLQTLQQQGVCIQTTGTIAENLLAQPEKIPVCDFVQGQVPGRSGLLALQKSDTRSQMTESSV